MALGWSKLLRRPLMAHWWLHLRHPRLRLSTAPAGLIETSAIRRHDALVVQPYARASRQHALK
eukprot:3681378-Amphidinium_carterae.1